MSSSDEDEYLSLSYAVVQRLAALTETKQLVMPLEVHITGNDDETIMHASVAERDGKVKFTNISGLPGDTPLLDLSAQYPLTVTITDVRGTYLEFKIEPDKTVN